ncbi:MAG: glycosyltransferase family 9 protein [Anaerolineae bacterium]|nr:glycosyltransferase family 9 protein [Anaerolineae bacterium]
MTLTTPPEQRAALAEKHRQELAASAGGTRREQARLAVLRLAGRRYRAAVPLPETPPQRILLIRPDHLGDLLFATPALRFVRERFPDAHIAALVGPWVVPVLSDNPDIDELLTCAFPGFTRQPKGSPLAPYTLLRNEARRLADGRFDLACILRFDHWWGAWLAAEAGIPRRIGYDIPSTRPFLTTAVPYIAGRHEVVQNLGLAGDGVWSVGRGDWGLGRMRFEVTAEDERAAGKLLAGLDDSRPLAAIHPGSGAAVKRWRTEGWVALVQVLIERHGVQVVFTGSASEAALIDPVLAGLGVDGELAGSVRSLAGRTDLATLAAVYRRCALVVGPDSGPLHLAVAVGTPTVHLYGPVDRRTFGPWGDPARHVVVTSDWPCIACNKLDWPEAALPEHGCVRDIAVDDVILATTGLLSEVP